MLISETVKTKWTKQNREKYEEKGYVFTKYNDKFDVKIEDLLPASHIKVKIKCDICGKIIDRPYREYKKCHSKEFGDLCSLCCGIKRKDTCIKKYGEDNPSKVEEFKNKRTETIIEKFGVENAFQSETIKEKIRKTNIEKYGKPYPFQASEVVEKTKQTFIQKYGVSNPNKLPEIREKIYNTNLQRYGYKCSLSSPEIRAKGRETLYKNNTVPSSKPEKELYNLLVKIYGENNCIHSFPYDRLSLDCLLVINNQKIDVEYDGWYWHKNKVKEDNRRNRFLISRGFKVFRVKANYKLPSEEEIKECIDYLLDGNDYKELILDI